MYDIKCRNSQNMSAIDVYFGYGRTEDTMIFVTMMNGERKLLNHKLIESAKENPDTTITMTSGKKLIIKESLDELFNVVLDYDRQVMDFKNLVENEE